MKHKRLTAAVLLLLIMVCCCGCTKPAADTEDHRPKPAETLTEKSDNALGARFCFTLNEYSEQFSRNLRQWYPDNSLSLTEASWTEAPDTLPDSNGVSYTVYVTTLGYMTLTAAVENDSGHVMSLGCGCDAERFADDADRHAAITMAAVMAQTAGGYDADSLDYLRALFEDVGADYSSLTYEHAQYAASFDGESVTLTISAAA